MIKFQKMVTSLADSLLVMMTQAAMLKRPMWHGTERTASKKLRPSVQQPTVALILPTTLGAGKHVLNSLRQLAPR